MRKTAEIEGWIWELRERSLASSKTARSRLDFSARGLPSGRIVPVILCYIRSAMHGVEAKTAYDHACEKL
jgi:hypothetical protein